MELNIASHQTAGYTVTIPVYEGPLDLLLRLIEHAELDITVVALAAVTDQFLTHIRQLDNARPDEISAFLVIAAKLIQIKSEALLPRPPVRDLTEDDPAENLARQLRTYKRFKEIANLLEERDARRYHTYLRLVPPPKIEGRLDLSEITLKDLLEAAKSTHLQEHEKQSLGSVISAPRITIRQKIAFISEALRKNKVSNFNSLVSPTSTRLEIVVTFLALLELIKRYRISAHQDTLFGDILIERSDEWEDEEEIELEFE
jgi:segregation and condensation protein A